MSEPQKMTSDERALWLERVEIWRKLAKRLRLVVIVLCVAVVMLAVSMVINAGKCHP